MNKKTFALLLLSSFSLYAMEVEIVNLEEELDENAQIVLNEKVCSYIEHSFFNAYIARKNKKNPTVIPEDKAMQYLRSYCKESDNSYLGIMYPVPNPEDPTIWVSKQINVGLLGVSETDFMYFKHLEKNLNTDLNTKQKHLINKIWGLIELSKKSSNKLAEESLLLDDEETLIFNTLPESIRDVFQDKVITPARKRTFSIKFWQ